MTIRRRRVRGRSWTWVAGVGFHIFLCTGGGGTLHAQGTYTVADGRINQEGTTQRRLSITFRNTPIADALTQLASAAGMTLSWSPSEVPLKGRVTLDIRDRTISEVLSLVMERSGGEATITSAGNVIVVTRAASSSKSAQVEDGRVFGRIVDSATGNGLRGVTVELIGTKLSATSDSLGMFQLLNVPSGRYQLSTKLLGYASKVQPVDVGGKASAMRIVLTPAPMSLSEVVTTATGLQRRVEVGHDIATINADSLMRTAPIRSVSDMLAVARIPGVVVETTTGLAGAPKRIRVRGIGSILGEKDPIVIVDGVRIDAPMSGERTQSKVQTKGSIYTNERASFVTSMLDDIDPERIEKIEVLRGPSAGTLYGTDAANGVIVITTKRGHPGPARWNVNVAHDWNEVPGERPPKYTGWGKDVTGYVVKCSIADVAAGVCTQDSVSLFDPQADPLMTTDASGATTTVSASVDGGTPDLTYSLSSSISNTLDPVKLREIDKYYLRQGGVEIPGWLSRPRGLEIKRGSLRLGLRPSDGLTVGLSTQLSQSARRMNQAGSLEWRDNVMDTLRVIPGMREVYRYNQNQRRLILGTDSRWNMLPWVTLNGTVGVDHSTSTEIKITRRTSFCESETCPMSSQARVEGNRESTVTSVNLNGSISSLGRRRLSKVLTIVPSFGFNLTRQSGGNVSTRVDSAKVSDGSAGSSWNGPGVSVGDSTSKATAGVFVDVRVGLFERLYTSFGLRKDIGSAFGSRAGFQNYPKFNTSWVVSDESFFPKSIPLDMLRLRVAVGMSGIQPVIGSVEGAYDLMSAVVNGENGSALGVKILGNPQLKPERAFEFEYGIDASLWNQRVDAQLSVANKTSRNVLLQQPVDPSVFYGISGGVQRWDNIGRVMNRSIEGSIDATIVDRDDLRWTIGTSGSTVMNKVTDVGRAFSSLFSSQTGRIVKGYPIGGIWTRPIVGYRDINGDGLIGGPEYVKADSLAYVGWGQPRYSMTYVTSLKVWNGRLAISANFAHDVGLTQIQANMYRTSSGNTDVRGLQDVTAPIAEQMYALQEGVGFTVGRSQTFSVLRFQSMGWYLDLPEFARRMRARTFALQLSASNLGLWTRYAGRDPGVNDGLDETRVDYGETTGQPRSYSLTFRVGL